MKQLYLITLFISSLCVLPTSNATNATRHANPVKLTLQQVVDKNCDGNTTNRQLAIPGACILYTITATNYGDDSVFNIIIKGRIPEYTKLFKPLPANSNRPSTAATLVREPANSEPHIQQVFSRLDPGEDHAIIMKYTVKIL